MIEDFLIHTILKMFFKTFSIFMLRIFYGFLILSYILENVDFLILVNKMFRRKK